MSIATTNSKKNPPPLLLRLLFRIPGMVNLIRRRGRYHWALTLLALLGIILAVGLVTDASFFSEAVDRVILTQELEEFSRVTGRPPFSTNVYVFPSNRNPLTLEDAESASQNIANTLSDEVGLPVRFSGLQVSSGSMILQPGAESELYGKDFLGNIEVAYVADVAGQMEISAGTALDEDGISVEAMDVWMHDRLVQQMGIQPGDSLIIRFTVLMPPIPVRVVGFWHARDPQSEFWFNNPDSLLKDALLVRRQDYIRFIQSMLPSGTREASWYVVLDEKRLIPRNGAAYLDGFQRAQEIISKYIPGVRLNTPPLDPLRSFVQRSQTLTILLLGYNLPAFGILLYFLALTSAIIAQWQRKETAILVSRGMSVSGVLNLVLFEQLLLFIVGYPLGIAFGMLVARLMGYTASFLSFTHRQALPVSLLGLSVPLTILALSVSLLTRLWPALRATRSSVVTEEREWARPVQAPFWYRAYLDLLLILPTYYAYDQMLKQGSLASLIIDRPEDIYRDPLLILVPALFVVTASLVTMRLFSLIMRVLDVLAHMTPWLSIHLALRQLGRQSHEYIRPLLLVIVSLALGVYTVSMAASLDQWLVDRLYYRGGADLVINPQPQIEGVEYADGNWIPAPQEFLEVPGVLAATRVGDYSARITLKTGQEAWGHFLAIDRLDFPAAAWFRPDLAPESLGMLMNRLALTPDGVLVSRGFLERSGFQPGDQISVSIDVENILRLQSSFTIVGIFTYFPTAYEEDEGATLVGNLDHLSALPGFILPHDLWLKLAPGVTGETIRKTLPGKVGIVAYPELMYDTRALLAEEQAKMERVGIFGTLSVGFMATTVMALLGLLIYSYASLFERVYRFAVLHAVGLTRRQITIQVVMEYAFLAFFGALAGALIGAYASQLFVPFFRYTGERGVPLPPLLPVIEQQLMRELAIIFTLVVVLTEVLTIVWSLRRRLVRIR